MSLIDDMADVSGAGGHRRSQLYAVPEAADELRLYIALCITGALEWNLHSFMKRRLEPKYGVTLKIRQIRNWIALDDEANVLWRAYRHHEDTENDIVLKWVKLAQDEERRAAEG